MGSASAKVIPVANDLDFLPDFARRRLIVCTDRVCCLHSSLPSSLLPPPSLPLSLLGIKRQTRETKVLDMMGGKLPSPPASRLSPIPSPSLVPAALLHRRASNKKSQLHRETPLARRTSTVRRGANPQMNCMFAVIRYDDLMSASERRWTRRRISPKKEK